MSRSGFLPALVWKHLPVRTPIDIDIDGRVVSVLLPDHDGVARQLQWMGPRAQEWHTIAAVVSGARRGNVVDVGANAGLMTVIAAAAGATVYAFEPVPRSFDWTLANIARNGLEESCRLRQVAVGDCLGTTEFHVPFGDAPSSASLGAAGYRGLDGDVIDVEVTTLDAELVDASISLIKVDVEGHEHRVLSGAEDVIARERPDLLLEVNFDGPWRVLDEWLHGHDYRARRLDGSDNYLTTVRTHEADAFRNIVCIPAERT